MIFLFGITFDCAAPGAVAAFWREALDYVQQMPSPEELEAAYAAHPEWRSMAVVEDELARHPRLLLQTVPEPKVGRNRIRFEVSLPEEAFDAEVQRLVSLGARHVEEEMLADPDGNEFEVRPGEDGVRKFSAIVIEAQDPDRLGPSGARCSDSSATGTGAIRRPTGYESKRVGCSHTATI